MCRKVETCLLSSPGGTRSVSPLNNGTTRRSSLPLIAALALGVASIASAQESPTPAPSETVIATPTASPSPTSAPTRNVRISFLPPPLEGTISLGIYDEKGQLVRVLHQEADLDEFTVGADALVTKWDGKNDDGQDLPAGTYQAHGYLVGNLKVETMGNSAPPDDATPANIKIRLMPNPLVKDERAVLEVGIGGNDQNSFLKTADGLPLFTLAEKPNVTRMLIRRNTDKSVDAWLDDGAATQQLHISNVNKMMAFDCGKLELR
jgi:hypothetical protein